MPWNTIPASDLDPGDPVKSELWGAIKNNDDDHETRIADLEADAAVTLLTGEIKLFAGASAPSGWAFCDGKLFDEFADADLFAVIGFDYNIGGEPANKFRVPDFRGKVPVGVNDGTLPEGTDGAYSTRSRTDATFGAEEENFNHQHTMSVHTHTLAHNHKWYNHTVGAANHDSSFAANGAGQLFTFGAAVKNGNVYSIALNEGATFSLWNSATPAVQAIKGATNEDLYTDNEAGSSSVPNPASTGAALSTTENNVQPSIVVNYIIKT